MIYSHLKDLKAFEKFHPLLLQQICYYSFYEDLEQGVIRTYYNYPTFIELGSVHEPPRYNGIVIKILCKQ